MFFLNLLYYFLLLVTLYVLLVLLFQDGGFIQESYDQSVPLTIIVFFIVGIYGYYKIKSAMQNDEE